MRGLAPMGRQGHHMADNGVTMGEHDQHVAILMGTRNGATHLNAQLQSFLTQTHRDWSLWVSDDGSDDTTRGILRAFRDANPSHRVTVLDGPRRGAAANYLSLLHLPEIPAGLVALSDQDDVWLPHKLSRAVSQVANGAIPVAYGAQSLVGNEDLTAQSAPHNRLWSADFGNALVQNILSGHTLVLNQAAREVVRQAGPADGIAFHDWWIYQVMAGHGARCIVDDAEVVIYRQHSGNMMGVSRGPAAAWARARLVLDGTFGSWAAAHQAALWEGRAVLSPEAVETLRRLREGTAGAGPGRVLALRRLGLKRTSRAARTLVDLAAFAGRF